METRKYILIEDCSKYYNIDTSFIRVLNDRGLIDLEQTEESCYLSPDQLSLLEKYMHLHYDLEINMEGIEAISHLLSRIEHLQEELRLLRS